ncbi:MAG: hypothetical protein ABH824_00415 [Nanoarchaeota archaeon]
MSINYKFALEIFTRYSEHLQNTLTSIDTYINNYDKQETELKRLASFKPKIYQKEYEKIQKKRKEADIKLSHIVPRMQKLAEQIEELKKVI